jgi:NAD(P)H dehydrogenase (quinone)
MTKSKVMVLGATGQAGKLVCDYLKQDTSIELVVTTRRKERLVQLSHIYGQAVYIDLDDPRTFPSALQGVDRLFLLTGYSVSMLTQSKTITDAATTAGVKHIVHLGVFSKAWDCTAAHFTWHQMIEVYIKNTGLKWTFLHPNCFLQNLTAFSVLTGNKCRWYTTKPCGWVALEDVAESTAQILKEGPEKHHAKEYWFSTESLDIYQVAEILSEVLGTKVIADPRSPDSFIKDLGADPKTIDPYLFGVADTCNQIEDGRMSYIGNVRDDVQVLLHRKGLSLREWARIHKAELLKLVNATEEQNLSWGKAT